MTTEQICENCEGVDAGYEEQRYSITVFLCPLHAAAPDLLAALQSVERVIKEAETPRDVWTAKRLMVQLGPQVRAAIQKATSPQAT